MVHGGVEGIIPNCQVMPCCRADTGAVPFPREIRALLQGVTKWICYDLEKGVGLLDWVKHIQQRNLSTGHVKLGSSRIPTLPPD